MHATMNIKVRSMVCSVCIYSTGWLTEGQVLYFRQRKGFFPLSVQTVSLTQLASCSVGPGKAVGLKLAIQLIKGGNYECLQLYEYFHQTSSQRDDKLSTTTVGIQTFLAVCFRRICKIAKSGYQLRYICTSVCPNGTTRLPMDGFSWNFILEYFSKICRENSSFIEI